MVESENIAGIALATDTESAMALKCACELGKESVIRFLIAKNTTIDKYCLGFVCEFELTDIVRLLLELPLERGVDPAVGGNYALRVACQNGRYDIVRMLLELERGVDPSTHYNEALRVACHNGHTEVVRMLLELERGVDPSTHYNEALRVACHNGHTEVVRMLLELERGVLRADECCGVGLDLPKLFNCS